MTYIKLNEQITFLRKQNNMTQESLAKAYFETTPAEDSSHNAFRLAILLHEAAVTRRYKAYCPRNTDRNHGLEEHPYKWGYSACSEPEGNTVYTGNGIFIASGKTYQSPTITQLKNGNNNRA